MFRVRFAGIQYDVDSSTSEGKWWAAPGQDGATPRPEGAATIHPRASPWVYVDDPHSSPEGAKNPGFLCTALSGLMHHWNASILIPGRCPGLSCGCPFGAKSRYTSLPS